jgi:hypothetical protein
VLKGLFQDEWTRPGGFYQGLFVSRGFWNKQEWFGASARIAQKQEHEFN